MNLYLSGLPAAKVGEKYGINEATIRAWIRIAGLITRSGGSYSLKHDKEIVDKIIEMYNSGLYTSEIEKNLGLKRGIASYILRKNNAELRHRGPQSMIKKEDFFDVIDSESKAYFLGWLMAYGNISITDNQYSLKIHIALRDKEAIDKFLEAIESSNKTKVKEGTYPSYYVSLTSVHMCKALMHLGLVPRKSGNEIFPDIIPSDLCKHFVRGVFDGDGITDISKKRSGFVGSKNMLTSILELIDETDRTLNVNPKNNSIYYFLGSKKFSRKLYDYMYKDSTIWLSRKRQRLEMICFD